MKRYCIEPHCPEAATYRGRCRAHARARETTIPRHSRVYSTKRWKMLRRRYLFDHSICEEPGCEALATDVHHIRDLSDGGAPYAIANLEALCHGHHSQRTRAAQLR